MRRGVAQSIHHSREATAATACSARRRRPSTSVNQARSDPQTRLPTPSACLTTEQQPCHPLLFSSHNKSLMGDLDLLSSKWDPINALVFLINDVGYENRDKLTLLATVCECVSVCVVARDGEGGRVRLQAALKSVYSLR